MQNCLIAQESPLLQSVLGGRNVSAGSHQREQHLHPNLEGIHRNENKDCITLVAPMSKIGIPTDRDYYFTIHFPADNSPDPIVIIHSEDIVCTPNKSGLVGIQPDNMSNLVTGIQGIGLQSIVNLIKSEYSRFYHWAVFKVEVKSGNIFIHAVLNKKGGKVVEEGKYTKRYIQMIPWDMKDKHERTITLARSYSYLSDDEKKFIEDTAALNLSHEESSRQVSEYITQRNNEMNRKYEEKIAAEKKNKESGKHRNSSSPKKSSGNSYAKNQFIQQIMSE